MSDQTLVVEPKTARDRLAPRVARIATSLMFAGHAALFASWTAHIPLVKARLGLSAGVLGLALLSSALGSGASMLLAGAAATRWGSRVVTLVTCSLYGITAVAVPVAPNVPALFVALFCWGAALGATDVAMNAQAVTVQRRYGRSIMSSFHAWWSLGALAGSGIGILAVDRGITLATQYAVFGPAMVIIALLLCRMMIAGDRSAEPARVALPVGDRRLLGLGVVVAAGLLCEGAAADWSAVYLTDRVHTAPSVAGFGYVAFAVAMLAGRAVGDRLVARFGDAPVVRILAAVAAVVLGVGLVAGTPGATLLGLAALGLGLAVVVPVVYTAAAALPGREPGNAIAAIATCGWLGFMAGPPIIGLIADATNLSVALAVLPVITLGIALTAGTLAVRR